MDVRPVHSAVLDAIAWTTNRGIVGGRKAGNLQNAFLAVFLPAVIVGGALFFLGSVFTGVPLFGLIAGLGGVAIALIHIGPLLLGAILGALL